MHYIKKKFIALPGLYSIPRKRDHRYSDLLFFILVAALPSSFFALIPQSVFYSPGLYDLNLFFFFSGLVYLIFYFKHFPKIWKIPSGKAFIILCGYLIFQFLYSYMYQEIPLREVITIFRKNFFWPIATLGFLLYAASMDSYRIERFFRWLFVVTFFMVLLYIVSNITGIDVFGAKAKEAYQFKGELLLQNVYAIPRYMHILFVFSFTASMVDAKFKNYWMWMSGLLLTIISIVRSLMAVYMISMVVIYFLTKFSRIPTYISKSLKQIFLLILTAIILVLIFPHHLERLAEKMGFTDSARISIVDYKVDDLRIGTYDFRINLIKEAYDEIEGEHLFFGTGYIREATSGTYDFVLGGDSLIPAVLYTEGVLGLVMRWLPLLTLLFYSLYMLSKKRTKYKLFWLVITALILPQFVNVIQTTIFTEYNRWYFIFALLLLLISKIEREKKLTNVS